MHYNEIIIDSARDEDTFISKLSSTLILMVN